MTTRPSTSTILRASVSVLNSYLLYKIWRKYGKGAFALAYGASCAQGLYATWPQIEAIWKSRTQSQEIRNVFADPEGFLDLISRLSAEASDDPLTRLFIKPENQE